MKVFAAALIVASLAACSSTPQQTFAQKQASCVAEGGNIQYQGRLSYCAYTSPVQVNAVSKPQVHTELWAKI